MVMVNDGGGENDNYQATTRVESIQRCRDGYARIAVTEMVASLVIRCYNQIVSN